jgi:hypothetical protein
MPDLNVSCKLPKNKFHHNNISIFQNLRRGYELKIRNHVRNFGRHVRYVSILNQEYVITLSKKCQVKCSHVKPLGFMYGQSDCVRCTHF